MQILLTIHKTSIYGRPSAHENAETKGPQGAVKSAHVCMRAHLHETYPQLHLSRLFCVTPN